jgi:hypothetical protein
VGDGRRMPPAGASELRMQSTPVRTPLRINSVVGRRANYSELTRYRFTPQENHDAANTNAQRRDEPALVA